MSTPDHETQTEDTPAVDTATEDANASKSVKRGGSTIGIIILLSLLWYLTADRFTPYTSQARVEGYVVGVAPKVAGLVTEVWVKNNQEVEEGQSLFQIDPLQYEIALTKAQSDLENARRQVKAGDAAVVAADPRRHGHRSHPSLKSQHFSQNGQPE